MGPTSSSDHSFQDNPDAVLTHISDLHFSSHAADTSSNPIWRKLGMAPHEFNLSINLGARIELLRKRYTDRFFVVATGDLTTKADEDAFRLVNNYLRTKFFITSETSFGLNCNKNLLIVPGNHDKWFDTPLFALNKAELGKEMFYYSMIPQLPTAVYRRIGSRDFVFFLLNSNKVSARWNRLLLNSKNVTGRGQVGHYQLGLLRMYAGQARAGSLPGMPADFSYENSIRVALLHHHMVALSPKNQSMLIDAVEVKACFFEIGIQLVLAGHEHYPYHSIVQNNSDEMFFSCAGSATQIGERINSFKVYSFNGNQMRMIQYEARIPDNKWQFEEEPASMVQWTF